MMPPKVREQAKVVESALEGAGWRVVSEEPPFENEWWAYAFWRVESVWSPSGASFVLAFTENDPYHEMRWLAATRERPRTFSWDDRMMSLSRGWLDELPGFVDSLADFRRANGG